MKKYLLGLTLATLFLFNTSPILADDEVRNMVVDVKAKGFTQETWMDNLESSNIQFGPNDKFQVQLKISNLGNRNQTNVKVTESLPANVISDSGSFVIPQIAAGQDFVKNITITVKDKQFVYAATKSNTIRYDINTDVGTKTGDFTVFYTNSGTKSTQVATESGKGGLPDTGPNLLLISGIVSAIAASAFGLRKFARGY